MDRVYLGPAGFPGGFFCFCGTIGSGGYTVKEICVFKYVLHRWIPFQPFHPFWGINVDNEIFRKLANRYKEQGLVLTELVHPTDLHDSIVRKYQLSKKGKILKSLNPVELLEDARKRGIIKSEF